MVGSAICVNGINLIYDDLGNGPAVLLVHGFPLCRAMWKPQLNDLEAAGYRVIVPDLRGFGDSDLSEGESGVGVYSDDLIELLDQLEVRQAVVVGMSMGGYVLFDMLRRYPERISGAVFCVTRSVADDKAGRARRLQLANDAIKYGPQVVADAFVDLLFAEANYETRPKLVEEVYGWMVATGSQGLAGGLLAMRERPESTSLLATIRVPSLVITAEQDRACPVEHGTMIAKGIAGSRLEIIPDAGHMVNLEQPNTFNHSLLNFLRTNCPTEQNNGTVGCRC